MLTPGLGGTSFVFINLTIILFGAKKKQHTNNRFFCSDLINIGRGRPDSSHRRVTPEADTEHE